MNDSQKNKLKPLMTELYNYILTVNLARTLKHSETDLPAKYEALLSAFPQLKEGAGEAKRIDSMVDTVSKDTLQTLHATCDVRRNYRYLLAEIPLAIVLNVFYLGFAVYNYCKTGHFGLFTEPKSAGLTRKMLAILPEDQGHAAAAAV